MNHRRDLWSRDSTCPEPDQAPTRRASRLRSPDRGLRGVRPARSGRFGRRQRTIRVFLRGFIRPSFYVPMMMLGELSGTRDLRRLDARDEHNMFAKARLGPGVTLPQAATAVAAVAASHAVGAAKIRPSDRVVGLRRRGRTHGPDAAPHAACLIAGSASSYKESHAVCPVSRHDLFEIGPRARLSSAPITYPTIVLSA